MKPTIGQLYEALDNYKSVFKFCSKITGNDRKLAFIMDNQMEFGLCFYFSIVENIDTDYTRLLLSTNGFIPNRAGYIGDTPTVLHRHGKNPATGLRARIRTLEELIKNNE
jgi:hypothetical protein